MMSSVGCGQMEKHTTGCGSTGGVRVESLGGGTKLQWDPVVQNT